jgi:hypothetical protein
MANQAMVSLMNRAAVGTSATADTRAAASPDVSTSPFDRRVLVVGGVVFAVLMALSDRYGFHRDELYMLDCARHLQASYVDQPVFAPLMARVSLSLFGVSVPGCGCGRRWPQGPRWSSAG